jgi:hypothetical protein
MTRTETSPGIAALPERPLYRHVVAGMHIGPMALTLPEWFGAVLTVAEKPGTVPDKIAHKHLHLSYYDMDRRDLDAAAEWVMSHIESEHPVLIRSEAGRQRPALVAGLVILGLGGFYADALFCLRKANPSSLTDFRYLALLRDLDNEINKRLK